MAPRNIATPRIATPGIATTATGQCACNTRPIARTANKRRQGARHEQYRKHHHRAVRAPAVLALAALTLAALALAALALAALALAALALAVLALAVLALTGDANAQPRREQWAAAKLHALCTADHGQLWGPSLCGPLLIADPQTRLAWGSEQDHDGLLERQGAGWMGVLPSGVGIANTSTHWAGVQGIMIMGPLPADAEERRVLVAHEAWHRIQTQIGFPQAPSDCTHLESERGRTLMRLEIARSSRPCARTAPRDGRRRATLSPFGRNAFPSLPQHRPMRLRSIAMKGLLPTPA